jgi:Uma2 family endonuclease
MALPAHELPSSEPAGDETDPSSPELTHDPYEYGWRERREVAADGAETLSWDPLSYRDLLDPQEGDVVAEDSVHRTVTEDVARILRRRYEGQRSVAVWSNLKILFEIPGLTTGPGPDICLVEGVRDRDLRRTSFRYGEEPGKVRLVIEIVSKNSQKKDYEDLLAIYGPLGVEEYVAIRPRGFYPQGPFELRGWRRDPRTGRLHRLRPDAAGRLRSRVTGLYFGTGAEGWGLEVWDAATGERLRTSEDELRWHAERADDAAERAGDAEHRAFVAEERADDAEKRARREIQARRAADTRAEKEADRAEKEAERAAKEVDRAEKEAERAEKEAEARRKAEEARQELTAEMERLRALLRRYEDGGAPGRVS